MKKRIHISATMIVMALLTLVGLLLVIKGIATTSKYINAVDVKDLKEADIKEGVCVRGYIDDYVTSEILVNDELVKDGVSMVLVGMDGDNHIYTVPIEGNKYIQFMIRDDSTKKSLEAMLKTPGEKAYFEGVIEKANFDVNEEWYGSVNSHTYPGINDIISKYYVKEIDDNKYWNSTKFGGVLLFVVLLMFVDAGGFGGLVDKTDIKEEKKRSNGFEHIYNKEDELINKEAILRQLMRRQKRIKNKKLSSIVMLVIGVLSLIIWRPLFIFGIILVVFGAKGFWDWFINSSNIRGIKLARRLGIDSLYLMIEQCKRDIKELEELIYNEERDEEDKLK